jgi:hypothetical protein
MWVVNVVCQRVWLALLVLALPLGTSGCAKILGVDGFRVGPSSADAGGEAGADKLFERKPPYLSGAACEACLKKQCADEQRACTADVPCTAWIAAISASTDPVTAQAAYTQFVEEPQWAAAHGGPDTSGATRNLSDCSSTKCSPACEIGRDFSCFGRFDRPTTGSDLTHVHFGLHDLSSSPTLPIASAAISWCAWVDKGCRGPHPVATTDGNGLAEFDISDPSSGTSGFRGVLIVDAGLDYYPYVFGRSNPIVSGRFVQEGEALKSVISGLAAAGKVVMDDAKGSYDITPLDCRRDGAVGVTVEAWVVADGGTSGRPCGQSECPRWYGDASGLPSAATDLSVSGAAAFFINLPAGNAIFVVRDTHTRRIVGVFQGVTFAGHWHTVRAGPPSTADLAGLNLERFNL